MNRWRTISLTGRPPVRIEESDWPVIAEALVNASDGSASWVTLKARRHDDGRVLVHGVLVRVGDGPARAGYLLDRDPDGEAILAAMHSTVEDLPHVALIDWAKLEDQFVAALPAVAI
jgi:hypothetical protein